MGIHSPPRSPPKARRSTRTRLGHHRGRRYTVRSTQSQTELSAAASAPRERSRSGVVCSLPDVTLIPEGRDPLLSCWGPFAFLPLLSPAKCSCGGTALYFVYCWYIGILSLALARASRRPARHTGEGHSSQHPPQELRLYRANKKKKKGADRVQLLYSQLCTPHQRRSYTYFDTYRTRQQTYLL